MTDVVSDPKADPAHGDEETTSNTVKVQGRRPYCHPKKAIVLSTVETYISLTVKWYRSTLYNALILGVCNFLAPGIWGGI